jgi:serine/threonine protein kinase
MTGTGSRPRPASIAPPAPPQGELIAEKYRVVSVLGEGAMGTVLAAHHELLDVPVAVKLLSPQMVRYPNLVERFVREARAVARLKSEHVARVMDVGQLDGGQPFIVMELLEGQDLERRLADVGALQVPMAVDYALQALEALAHAHAIGIVHRDLKPANLFVTTTPDGRELVKVLDFGIAKLSDLSASEQEAEATRLTGDDIVLGSPSYMAPEQVRSAHDIDKRADIWAMGAILYEMLTGATAFVGDSVGSIFRAVLDKDAPALRGRRTDAPEELEAAIARCLERDPAKRFADVAEMARAIAPFGSGALTDHVERIEQTLARAGKGLDGWGTGGFKLADLHPSERRVRAPTPAQAFAPVDRKRAAEAETMAQVAVDTTPGKPRSRTGVLLLGVTIGAVLAAGGGVAFVHMRGAPAPTPAAAPRAAPNATASAATAAIAATTATPPASGSATGVASAATPTASGARAVKSPPSASARAVKAPH